MLSMPLTSSCKKAQEHKRKKQAQKTQKRYFPRSSRIRSSK